MSNVEKPKPFPKPQITTDYSSLYEDGMSEEEIRERIKNAPQYWTKPTYEEMIKWRGEFVAWLQNERDKVCRECLRSTLCQDISIMNDDEGCDAYIMLKKILEVLNEK